MSSGASATPGDQDAEWVYDAFVSYSRVDKSFANALTKTLESYKAPRDLALPQRNLKIFRDEADFTGVEYFASVKRHLTNSRSLIVLCSPDARRSAYVNDEIRRFAEFHGAERIVPVLCAGIPNNEATHQREAEKAFPDALCELMEMPLAVNYVGFDAGKDKINKGAFENSWYTLLANLFGLTRNEIEQRDKRRQARQRKVRLFMAAAFLVTILIGLAASLFYWRQAVLARDQAFSRELAANALGQMQADPDLSVKLAVEALRVSPTLQAEAALRESLTKHQVLAVMIGKKPVRSAALSSDGRSLATAGDDKILRLWEVATGALITELSGHAEPIVDVNFSPDGRLVVTASWDNTARIWDVAAKRSVHELPDHGAIVTSARFGGSNGELVATGDGAGKVRIWDGARGRLMRKIDAHSWDPTIVQGKTRVAFSPNGSWLLTSAGNATTATGDPVARLWNTQTGALVREFPSKGGVVVASLFSGDGNRVLIASTRDHPRVWETSTGKRLGEFPGSTGLVDAAAFSADGSLVLSADTNGNGAIWHAQTGAARTRLVGSVTAAAFDETGERVAASDGEIVRVWDAQSGALLHTLRGHQGDVDIVQFGRDSETLISASEDSTARVWSVRGVPKESALSLRGRGETGPIFSPNGRLLMARSPGRALVWEVSSEKELAALETGWAAFDRRDRILLVERTLDTPRVGEAAIPGMPRVIPMVKFPYPVVAESRDGALVLTERDPFLGVVWDSASWKEIAIFKGHQGRVTGAVFDRDARRVMTVSEDSSARFWDVATARLEHTFRLNNRGHGALISPDGRWVCALEDSAKITVWDATTWRPLHEFVWTAPPAGGNWVKSAAFSPDGSKLAAGDNSGMLHILDVRGGKTLATIKAHTYEVQTVAFGSDGRLILTSGGGDRGARVWDSFTGAKVAEVGTEFLQGAVFSPDGSRVATLSSEGTVRVFNWQRFAPVEQLVILAARRVKRDWTPGERERYFHEKPQ
jgi:WD40 repeat protein